MPTLLETVNETLTPELTTQISEMLGTDKNNVHTGVRNASALIIGALSHKAATDEGADQILASFDPAQDAPANVFTAIDNGRSDAILYPLFGIGVTKVVHWIQNTTDQDLGSYLLIAAPLLYHALAEQLKNGESNAESLRTLLKTDNDAFARADPQFASEINAALDAGENVVERAARIRARFTEEEFTTLAKTPTLAAYAVMMSSLSGPVGVNKEIEALLEAMEEYGAAAEPDSLVGIVSRQFTSPDQITTLGANRENASSMMRDACLESLKILTAKESHEEVQSYKKFVLDVSTHVAEAAIDGGFMSIGGKAVSDEEKQTLDLIAAALAYTPES